MPAFRLQKRMRNNRLVGKIIILGQSFGEIEDISSTWLRNDEQALLCNPLWIPQDNFYELKQSN